MSLFKIENGAEVKDNITGFAGIVTARVDYVTGCRQYCVQPPGLNKEGAVKAEKWFDEDRLTSARAPKMKKGGPQMYTPPTK